MPGLPGLERGDAVGSRACHEADIGHADRLCAHGPV